MRSVDRPTPTIDNHRPASEPWPAVLHIGIERQPEPTYVWDDATAFWDDPAQQFTWDDREPWPYDRMDLWCRFHGLTITTGFPDDEGIFESGHVEASFDNRDGALSLYDETGRLVDWQPGSPLDIWVDYAGESFWLFSGRITAWRERADGMLDVEAFDAFTQLQTQLGEWTPGTAGQTVPGRLTSCCTAAGYGGPRRFAIGNVTLLTEPTEDTPLEQMQLVALSDGGALFCDADGTVVYADREWAAGRADQEQFWTVSDNYCDAPVHVWDTVLTTDDDSIVNTVTLTNIAEPDGAVASAMNEPSRQRHGVQTWPNRRNDDLWATQPQGQALADFIVSSRGDHYVRIEQFALYLHDPKQVLWPLGIDTRLGDLIDFQHEQPTVSGLTSLIQLRLAVESITHEITPDAWVTTLATTPAVDHVTFYRWDQTVFTWDDPDPRNVWAY